MHCYLWCGACLTTSFNQLLPCAALLPTRLACKPCSATSSLAVQPQPFASRLQNLRQVGELGHGTFGVVVKALDMRERPPREVAIKLLSRGNFIKQYKTYVKREIDNQSRLRHPLIVSIQEVGPLPTAV